MLGGDDDGVEPLGSAVFVIAHRDLALAVGQDKGHLAVFAHLRQLAGQLVGKGDGGGHQLPGLPAGVAEHHALVAGADQVVAVSAAGAVFQGVVDAHGDVGALAVDGGQHGAGLVVKAVAGAVVADVFHGLPDDALHIHLGVGGHFAHHHHHAGGGAGLTGHVGAGVLGQDRVQNAVGHLVAQLVGMAFGDAFRRKQSLDRHFFTSFLMFFRGKKRKKTPEKESLHWLIQAAPYRCSRNHRHPFRAGWCAVIERTLYRSSG